MQRAEHLAYPTLGWAAWNGAKLAVAMTFGYALLFILYASTRSAITILAAGDSGTGVLQTILATSVSVIWTSLVFAFLLALPASVLGALTAPVIAALLPRLISNHDPRRAFLVGLNISLVIAIVFYIALRFGLQLESNPATAEALLFWLDLPTLIYVIAGGVGGWQLARSTRFD